MILKQKQVVIVSHCILNQNTVVNGLQRAPGAFPLCNILIESGVGILQLPCPEFFMYNLDRPGLSYEEYDTPEFHLLSRKLLEPVIWQIKQYLKHSYEIIGIIGINQSPSCSLSGQRGVYKEVLLKQLEELGIFLRKFEVPEKYGTDPGADELLHHQLKQFLEVTQ